MFTQYSSAQFDKETPFTITKACYQDWFGGRTASKGTLITLELTDIISSKIVIDSIFFQKEKEQFKFF